MELAVGSGTHLHHFQHVRYFVATAKVVHHVLEAEHAYAQVMGIKVPSPHRDAPDTIATMRAAMLEALRMPSDGSPIAGRKWPPRYGARRIAWHVLDHAWEIEDRSEPE